MQLTAKLILILPIQSGSGKNGQWKKQDIIVETDGQYPKKVCITVWGNNIDESLLKIGNLLKIDINIESREYNNKWYTSITARKIELANMKTQKKSKDINGKADTDEDDWSTIDPEDLKFDSLDDINKGGWQKINPEDLKPYL